jgi:hypothetical protein
MSQERRPQDRQDKRQKEQKRNFDHIETQHKEEKNN